MYHVCEYPYYSCLDTLWHCHPYFTLQFHANVFVLVTIIFFQLFLTILEMVILLHQYINFILGSISRVSLSPYPVPCAHAQQG